MKLLILASMIFGTSLAFADDYVHSYQKKDGTTVQGYERTERNDSKNDNYSTKGNTNPYTGKEGTKSYDDYDK